MTLPLLLSVPHAGVQVPDFLENRCVLSHHRIELAGDIGARAIFDLAGEVAAFVTTDVARAVLDVDRAEDDRGRDGVVKTHTGLADAVWSKPLSESLVQRLLREHHRPYHDVLTARAGRTALAIDCHTVAAVGPADGPDPGAERPMVCLGDGGGLCPADWMEALQSCFARQFQGRVSVDEPLGGGYVTRTHGNEMPWVQLEVSRSPEMNVSQKRGALLAALTEFCASRSW
ncbi:N-formylglutamate amidohydrolase [Engelhardtia mirabilis]|uniref:N-formylglutamate amidohydrolase n=1 Tax=Engelhardtia mirabilis TaxID=2528011 RepID=A0A518BRX8_9BACT|nr:N-formylglutamate amidohydrolase [Planctomycetes bacterium Pla133]QDV04058.1 N-formylglutamate amidohydrolase [Planctomycetes bacterium Pla86]